MPEWFLPLLTDYGLPIGLLLAFGILISTGVFVTGAELRRLQNRHADELAQAQLRAKDWRTLYERERQDRIASNERLAQATSEIHEIVAGIDELTREVIRGAK